LHSLDQGVRATPPLRTVLDCAAFLPFEEALAVADSALRHSFVRPQELVAAAASAPRGLRRRQMRVARSADRRAVNAFESRLRAIVLAAGLTGFEPQLEIRTPAMVVHADLAHPELRIAIEADSFAHHGSRAALARDCERYDELVADGWVVLRFAWEHVMFRPEWVSGVVAAAVRRRRSFVTYARHAEPDRRVGRC
jgi:very-short-patch-repair endonuclease